MYYYPQPGSIEEKAQAEFRDMFDEMIHGHADPDDVDACGPNRWGGTDYTLHNGHLVRWWNEDGTVSVIVNNGRGVIVSAETTFSGLQYGGFPAPAAAYVGGLITAASKE